MEEKIMVSDALESVNGELTRFGEMIPQTENMQLKQTLKQIRNQCETSQEELFLIAKSKNYYKPAEKASQEEIMKVKNIFTGMQMK
jgi:spore coat protein CotF